MANNILVEPSTDPTAVSVATDDIDGRQFQVIKVSYGAEDSATYVDSTNPLPVSVGNFPASSGLTDEQLRDSPVPVSLSGVSTESTLSALKSAIDSLSAKITACNTGSVTLDAGTLAALENITATISGSVAVTGSVEITNDSGNAIPVSGTVSTGLSQPLTDTQLRASSVPVSGTFYQATQPVSGPLTDTELRATAVPVSGTVTANTGLTQPLTDAQLREDPVETSGFMDWFLRRILRAVGRLSFDTSNQLRTAVSGSVSISSGTVTTVSTGNMGMGDMGKPATAVLMTRTLSSGNTKRNLIRS